MESVQPSHTVLSPVSRMHDRVELPLNHDHVVLWPLSHAAPLLLKVLMQSSVSHVTICQMDCGSTRGIERLMLKVAWVKVRTVPVKDNLVFLVQLYFWHFYRSRML